LSGICEYKGFLNELVFQEDGHTANGAPYFKSVVGGQYVYYDADCNGADVGGLPMWVIDDEAPNQTRMHDMDDDGGCKYHARVHSSDISHPPMEGHWHVFCGSEWTVLEVTFNNTDVATLEEQLNTSEVAGTTPLPGVGFDTQEEPQFTTTMTTTTTLTTTSMTKTQSTTTTLTETSTTTSPAVDDEQNQTVPTTPLPYDGERFSLTGACADKAFLGEIVFALEGRTASGAPYYKSEALSGQQQYIYYDPACGGVNHTAGPRWIIDIDAPDVTRTEDLDDDGACDYYARTTGTSIDLPTEAMWHILCDSAWVDLTLKVDKPHDGDKGSVIDMAMPAMSGFAATLAIVSAAMATVWC